MNPNQTHYLYRIWDDNEVLLYIGMTGDIDQRLRHHKKHSNWWCDPMWVEIETYPNRWTVVEAEWRAIGSEIPIANRLQPTKRVKNHRRGGTTAP